MARWAALVLSAVALTPLNARADEGCGAFTWDLSREFAAMRTPADLLTASADVRVNPVRLKEGSHVTATLLPQSAIGFVFAPARQPKSPNPTGGLLFFKSGKAGVYRVSLTPEHRIDMLDGAKLVEFELPANRELTIQLSGHDAAAVGMVITAVASV